MCNAHARRSLLPKAQGSQRFGSVVLGAMSAASHMYLCLTVCLAKTSGFERTPRRIEYAFAAAANGPIGIGPAGERARARSL